MAGGQPRLAWMTIGKQQQQYATFSVQIWDQTPLRNSAAKFNPASPSPLSRFADFAFYVF
jgi:hypothetical protein